LLQSTKHLNPISQPNLTKNHELS